MKAITQTNTSIGSKILFNFLKELSYTDIKDFQSKNKLTVDGIFGLVSYNTLYNSILTVKSVEFESNYWKSDYPKQQIIWHHSAGWDNARGMFDTWKRDGRTHVATAIGITDDGTIYRGFDEMYWASSIGCKQEMFAAMGIKPKQIQDKSGKWISSNNQILDMGAVAVEVCNAGCMKKDAEGNIKTWFDAVLPKEKVLKLKYKGYDYFEKYTSEEIESLKKWTILQAIRFDIPLTYSHDDMWKVSKKAMNGEKGLFTHNSYREDKTDVSPQPLLIEMAKSLELYMS